MTSSNTGDHDQEKGLSWYKDVVNSYKATKQRTLLENDFRNKRLNRLCYQFNGKYLLSIITDFMQQMGVSDLDIWPTVDGMCNESNKQPFCHRHITEKEDFFETGKKLSKDDITWINPPFTKNMIQRVGKFIKQQKINCYLCLPYGQKRPKIVEHVVYDLPVAAEYIFTNCRKNYQDLFHCPPGLSYDIIVYYVSYSENLKQKDTTVGITFTNKQLLAGGNKQLQPTGELMNMRITVPDEKITKIENIYGLVKDELKRLDICDCKQQYECLEGELKLDMNYTGKITCITRVTYELLKKVEKYHCKDNCILYIASARKVQTIPYINVLPMPSQEVHVCLFKCQFVFMYDGSKHTLCKTH